MMIFHERFDDIDVDVDVDVVGVCVDEKHGKLMRYCCYFDVEK